MKRILSIIAAMALLLSMAVVSVYAEEADEASAQADCPHTSGTVVRSVYSDKIEPVNDSAHGNPVYDHTYCIVCGSALGTPTRRFINMKPHTFSPETYCGSNHSGNYTEHYYTYRQVCSVCNRAVERRGSTGCTAKRCIEPQ